jgi:hypothetical protein
MPSRQVFRLMIAGLGLYLFGLAILDLQTAALETLRLYENPPGMTQYGIERFYAVRALVQFVVGTLFMGGFFPLENFAFPLVKDDAADKFDAPAEQG